MTATIQTREQIAAKAYLSTFEGEWGLKASEEDALYSVLRALYPAQFPDFSDVRESPAMQEIADVLSEELAGEGMDADEIATHLVPMIDEAMSGTLLAEAERRGVDVEKERCDWYFLAQMLHEIRTLPDEEIPAAVRAVNDGATPADRHLYDDSVCGYCGGKTTSTSKCDACGIEP